VLTAASRREAVRAGVRPQRLRPAGASPGVRLRRLSDVSFIAMPSYSSQLPGLRLPGYPVARFLEITMRNAGWRARKRNETYTRRSVRSTTTRTTLPLDGSSVCDLLRLREKLLLEVLEPGRRAQAHICHLEERVQLIHTPSLNGHPELCGNLNKERPERMSTSGHQCSSVLISAHQCSSVLISAHQCSSVSIRFGADRRRSEAEAPRAVLRAHRRS